MADSIPKSWRDGYDAGWRRGCLGGWKLGNDLAWFQARFIYVPKLNNAYKTIKTLEAIIKEMSKGELK